MLKWRELANSRTQQQQQLAISRTRLLQVSSSLVLLINLSLPSSLVLEWAEERGEAEEEEESTSRTLAVVLA
jgi:hypothetical protein